MRRNARSLIIIAILVLLSGLILGIQTLEIGNFERGGDTLLGLSLGLDLQGGSHLVYQAKVIDEITGEPVKPSQEDMEGLRRIIERRINNSGLGEPIIQLLGDDRLLVQLPGVRDPDRAKTLIGETAQLEFKHRSLNVPRPVDEISNEDVISVSADFFPTEEPAPEVQIGPQPAETATSTSESQAEGTKEESQAEPTSESASAQEETTEESEAEQVPQDPPVLIVKFTDEGAARFNVIAQRLLDSIIGQSSRQVPPSSLEVSIHSEQPLKYQLTGIELSRVRDTNQFAFRFPQLDGQTEAPTLEEARAALGDNPQISFVEIQGAADEDFGLTGDNLLRAYPSQQSASGIPIVNLEFDSDGTRKFGEKTSEIAGSLTDQIAIFLDDQELISPVVTTAITTGIATIQGGFTIERARDIALLLESGRLPVPVELVQERDVDAILGADSLAKSVQAGMVGLGLVLLFMALHYRLPGIIASVALIIYASLVLAVFKILPVTLTLSGIAALILSVGMAVDANILIFERMKDELRLGRTLMSAINIGFNRAWPAIRDGNVSTLITCGILFWFSDQLGTTVVQGFAATLAIGVLLSMFSAIVISRTLLRVVVSTRLSRHLSLFIADRGENLQRQEAPTPAVQRS